MALIQVKYDSTIEQSDIIGTLYNTSPDESGDNYEKNYTDLQQTSIYGIQCPIIAVNNVMIGYDDILSFELDDTKHIPTVSAHILDSRNIIGMLNAPNNDNELRVQILPPFDDVYKKINLTFIITSFSQGNENDIFISGEYKLSSFVSSRFKSMGEQSIYSLFDTIASETKLGFATNVEDADDKRFVYCPYISYKTTIEKEIGHSGNETLIYDWWVDVWNYLNLVDIYERYNAIDNDDDMQVWISNSKDEVSESIKQTPIKTKAELTNLFGSEESQLFVSNYRIINTPGLNVRSGTDKVYSVYKMNDNNYKDVYISDGDVKKDIYNNFEYKGEVYGDYDYITNGMYRDIFLQKIKTNIVEVDLNQPLLGIQRGNRVVFAWYFDDDYLNNLTRAMSEAGVYNDNAETNVPIEEIGDTPVGSFTLDKSVSGQYLVIGNVYSYSNKKWRHTVKLARPADQNPKLIPVEE